MALIQRGFQAYDGNHIPDFVKNGNFERNKDSSQAQDLVAWWPMMPSGGLTLRDFSGRSNDGALQNMEADDWKTTEFGGWSLDFGGTNEFVTVPTDPSIQPNVGPLTVSGWFKTSTTGATQMLVSNRDNADQFWFLRIETSNVLRGHFKQNGSNFANFTAATTITDGLWHHVAMVWGGGNNLSIYLDGLLDGTPSFTGTVADVDNGISTVWLAAENSGDGPFTGELFDVRMNKAAFPEGLAHSLYDPSTRWDLYHELGRRTYSFPAAVTATTMVAAQGSYTLTGKAANTLWGHAFAASQGSYTLTGKAAITVKDTPITAAQGSYALTGQASNLLWGHLVDAVQGSYALTGQTAVLSRQITITAVQGSYVLTGQAAELKRHLVLAAQGSYALTGQAAILSRQVTIVGAQGSYTLTGQAANLLWGHLVAAAQGSYALTGQAAVTTKDTPVVAAQGAYSLTGQAANLLWGHALPAVQGSYALTGKDALIFEGARLIAVQGNYALNGQAVVFVVVGGGRKMLPLLGVG